MRDNETMNDNRDGQQTQDTRTALEALAASDPAQAPEIAEGLTAGLQRELDPMTDADRQRPESSP
ncbi:MAG: hypothetical protein BMS9Abin20_0075 [Acidimicrobiia bacterium]|nr:MAG: hypothetical protein BMS9Abin20_0075 [Acidimicrobiia bacterium]